VQLLGQEASVSVQSPIQTTHAQPVPDVAILKLRADRYRDALPAPADVLLLIEVADSSVLFDRNVKSRLYARAEIPEYWVIDLTQNTVVVCRSPRGGEYAEVQEHGRDRSFTSPALAGRAVRVEDLLGP
ncbi:MAG TPA: Uma2 family endonuclease, partial [Longimicrobiaceae bacterium]|nr:Uma2 family endonuclease [Longimicrobiaceae bacterium]